MQTNKEILILEDKITKLVAIEGKTIHFEYNESTIGYFEVIVYSFNSKFGETFLLKRVVGVTYELALAEILNYVEHSKKTMGSYTVTWSKKVNGNLTETNISYFYCQNLYEVLDKFYFNKDIFDYVIFNIKLNPIS